MSNIKIVKEVVEGVLSGASDIIEALPSNEKKQSAKNQLAGLTYNALNTALDSQEEVLKAELSGNWLQKSWRPLIMLGFGFIVMYSKFIAPAFGLPNTELNGEFWASACACGASPQTSRSISEGSEFNSLLQESI